jgi:hypothetical protein
MESLCTFHSRILDSIEKLNANAAYALCKLFRIHIPAELNFTCATYSSVSHDTCHYVSKATYKPIIFCFDCFSNIAFISICYFEYFEVKICNATVHGTGTPEPALIVFSFTKVQLPFEIVWSNNLISYSVSFCKLTLALLPIVSKTGSQIKKSCTNCKKLLGQNRIPLVFLYLLTTIVKTPKRGRCKYSYHYKSIFMW